jgi:hypothetical protein
MDSETTTLRRVQIREILARHYGAKAEVARSLNINRARVTTWLKGRYPSQPLANALQKKALDLLEQEKKRTESAA